MAEPFKELINPRSVEATAAAISKVWPAFDKGSYVAAATAPLAALELKARVVHVANTLRAALPAAWPDALDVLVRSLPPPLESEEAVSQGFALWPVLTVVELHGLGDPERSVRALKEMTRRFSAEFAIRPFLIQHPDLTWSMLEAWVADPDLHVRRWLSEGTRPRLPWGQRLAASVADPNRGLRLITALLDDPSPFVRRSVANHLGDIAKDHPALAVEVARGWLTTGDPERARTVRHGLRDLCKRGDADALALFGVEAAEVRVTDLAATSPVQVGQPVEISAKLSVLASARVRVDLVWSWPSARGGWSSKVFRGDEASVSPEAPWTFRGRLATAPVSTRPTRLGTQRVTLRVQGKDLAQTTFELVQGSA